jgi:hypothetical protein
MLQTPQRYPRAGSQSYPSPAAEASADGSTTVYLGPTQPAGVQAGNWIQTMPGKGWWVILRLYSPLEPFFTKQWRLSEIEAVNMNAQSNGRSADPHSARTVRERQAENSHSVFRG